MEKVSESNRATAMVVRPPNAAELEESTNILLVTKPMIMAGGLFGISPIHAFAITALHFTEHTVIGVRGPTIVVEFPKDLQYISVRKELIEFFDDSPPPHQEIKLEPPLATTGLAITPGQYL